MKSKLLTNILSLCCVFMVQLARAQDATTNTTDSGAASQTQTNSASYGDTMKWISSKLEIWTDVRGRYENGDEWYESDRIKQYDSMGNVEMEIKNYERGLLVRTYLYSFNLSNIENIVNYQNPDNHPTIPAGYGELGIFFSQPLDVTYNGEKALRGGFSISLTIHDENSAIRIMKAFQHAIKLKKKKELF